MIDLVNLATGLFHQYSDQFMAWYNAAGMLTQYFFVIGSGMAVFMIGLIMILSRITK